MSGRTPILKGEHNDLKGGVLLATIDLPIQLSPCDKLGTPRRKFKTRHGSQVAPSLVCHFRA